MENISKYLYRKPMKGYLLYLNKWCFAILQSFNQPFCIKTEARQEKLTPDKKKNTKKTTKKIQKNWAMLSPEDYKENVPSRKLNMENKNCLLKNWTNQKSCLRKTLPQLFKKAIQGELLPEKVPYRRLGSEN